MSSGTETLTAVGTLRIRARETDGIPRQAEPVTLGVPLPRGAVPDPRTLGLRGPGGGRLPCQTEVLDCWTDGSVRWALLDFAADLAPHETGEWTLDLKADGPAPPPSSPVRVDTAEGGLRIDTGAADFALNRGGPLPLASVRADGRELLDPDRSGLRCVDGEGREWKPAIQEIETESDGPLRATVRVEGDLVHPGQRPILWFVARLHFYAGSPSVRLDLTVRNPRRAAHPGGHWDLGDAGSALLRDLSLRFAGAGTRISWSTDPSEPLAAAPADSLEVYQDSSGGDAWRSRVHETSGRDLPTRFCGYRLRIGTEERSGRRATPRVVLHDGSSGLSVSMRRFWQNFPKAIDASDGALSVHLFPDRFGALHEIQGGEQKTHEIWLTFGRQALTPAADIPRRPLLACADPGAFASSGAIPYLVPKDEDPNELHQRLAEQAIEGDESFERKRELADEFGWRHFGETWADHESKFHEGTGIFRSHYNNQYDVVYGAFLQFARSGDPRWFAMMEELARHVIDIDIYHTDEDKAAYNRGLFWHTVHYVDADLSTHRSYPARGSCGGGPDDEHNYTTGLMHYHFLTGNPLGRETAIDSARWVIDADDGDQTILRWIDRRPTGLASKTRDFHYHGPGRGAGNSINALIDGWRLTGEERFLDKCGEVLRRTVHPDDDPGRHDLLDAENRWSYTVCLQAIGKLLDSLAEAGRLDETYAYARESLLTYARWMAEHERPTLDRSEDLDFPTETWPAQDLRKSDVFLFAALHTAGEERERFLERGEFFLRESLTTLDSHPTKAYTRPVVLVMQYGLMHSWLAARNGERRPAPRFSGEFEPPTPFVPQKTAAVAKLKKLVVLGGVGALVGAAAIALTLLGR